MDGVTPGTDRHLYRRGGGGNQSGQYATDTQCMYMYRYVCIGMYVGPYVCTGMYVGPYVPVCMYVCTGNVGPYVYVPYVCSVSVCM